MADILIRRPSCQRIGATLWFRTSHFSGLLELAEKERHRHKKRASAAEEGAGLTEEEVQARQQAADAQMAALIEAEETQKVLLATQKCLAVSLLAQGTMMYNMYLKLQYCLLQCFVESTHVVLAIRLSAAVPCASCSLWHWQAAALPLHLMLLPHDSCRGRYASLVQSAAC